MLSDRMSTKFTFQEKEYDYLGFKATLTKVKSYQESSHLDRILYKNTDGQLFLYEFYEYVNFSGSDAIYETFTVVESEDDADTLNKEHDIRREPYLRILPNYFTEINGVAN